MNKKNFLSFGKSRLDKKDLRILYELELDGRAPIAKIAKKAGLSRQSARYRLSNLIKRGFIWGFIAYIDFSRLGYQNFDVWIQLREIPESKKQKVITYFRNHPNILWLSENVGSWDICASFLARNIGHFYSLLNAALEKFPGAFRDYNVSSSVSGSWYNRPYLLDESRQSETVFYWKSDSEQLKTEKNDLRIMKLISENARIPKSEMAKILGLEAATVGRHIKRLEKLGVIQGYAGISLGKIFGLSRYEILIKLRGMTLEKEKAIEEYCHSDPYVYLYLKTVGRWDADICVEAKSSEHLRSLISGLRENFPDTVVETEVVSIVKEYRLNFFPGTLLD